MTQNDPRLPEGDDGHTITDMNVEGMPWYEKEQKRRLLREKLTGKKQEMIAGSDLTRFTFSAVAAALLVVLIFSVALVLFVLFCIHVWFR